MQKHFLMLGAALAVLAAAPAGAQTLYSAGAAEITAKPAADFLGTIDPATPVKVLEK